MVRRESVEARRAQDGDAPPHRQQEACAVPAQRSGKPGTTLAAFDSIPRRDEFAAPRGCVARDKGVKGSNGKKARNQSIGAGFFLWRKL
jgi:hypothetical protein